MSLLRLVLLTIISAGHHVSYTTPSNPDAKDEDHSWLIERMGMMATMLQRYYIWVLTGIEALVQLASWHLSRHGASFSKMDPFAEQVINLLCPSTPSPSFGIISAPLLISVGLVGLGSLLRVACYRTMGEMYTFHHITRSSHTLCTSGPYSYVRHPGYTALLLLTPGMLMCLFAPGGWAKECGVLESDEFGARVNRFFLSAYAAWTVLQVVGLMLRAFREDNMLKKRFGPVWEVYRKETPWKFVPYLG